MRNVQYDSDTYLLLTPVSKFILESVAMGSSGARYSICTTLLALLLAAGCATGKVSPPVPLLDTSTESPPPENLLLDIAISILEPVAEPSAPGAATLQNLRIAEGHYTSWQLVQTLQRSGHWGNIRLNPFMQNNADLLVSGAILQSDGETLRIRIRAEDATKRLWLDKEYYQIIDTSAYTVALGGTPPFPFGSLLNQIANDLLAFRENRLAATALAEIQLVSALNFAVEFAPEVYGPYLTSTGDGRIKSSRLPATNDPVFAEIETMRARNELFVDAIQGQYQVFARQVDEPYRRFLARSHRITASLNTDLIEEREAARYGGATMIGPLVEARSVDGTRISFINRRSDSLNSGANARAYAAALAQAGNTFEMAVQPQTLRFSTHTFNLSGTLEEQFNQWREILGELHTLEVDP